MFASAAGSNVLTTSQGSGGSTSSWVNLKSSRRRSRDVRLVFKLPECQGAGLVEPSLEPEQVEQAPARFQHRGIAFQRPCPARLRLIEASQQVISVSPINQHPGGQRRRVGFDAIEKLEGSPRLGLGPRQRDLGHDQEGPRITGKEPKVGVALRLGLIESLRPGQVADLLKGGPRL